MEKSKYSVNQLQSISILMVEDDRYFCRFIRSRLEHYEQVNFHVTQAVSLRDAKQKLSLNIPDVILLDLSLPDSTGTSTLLRLKELAGDIPIIILTGSDEEENGLDAVSHGAQDYLVKHQLGKDSLIRCLLYAIERRKSEEAVLRRTAIKDFSSALAHEIRMPLTSSAILFDSLLSGRLGDLSDQQRLVIQELKNAGRKQLELVEKLLEIYKYEADISEYCVAPVCLKALLTNCMLDVMRNYGLNQPLKIVLPEALPCFPGNEESLGLLFGNLLENAVKHTDDISSVEVSVELTSEQIVVRVRNSGPPMDEHLRKGLFRTFWQGVPGQSYVAHVGLGLYLCQRVTSLHSGVLTCSSNIEEGTCVTVRLPLIAKTENTR